MDLPGTFAPLTGMERGSPLSCCSRVLNVLLTCLNNLIFRTVLRGKHCIIPTYRRGPGRESHTGRELLRCDLIRGNPVAGLLLFFSFSVQRSLTFTPSDLALLSSVVS